MKRFIYLIGLLSLLLSACAPQGPQTLTVLTHDSFSVSEDLIRQFESDTNVKISFVKGGDAGSVLNQSHPDKRCPAGGCFVWRG